MFHKVLGEDTQKGQRFRPIPTEDLGEDDVSAYSDGMRGGIWCPEEEAGLFSKMFFSWVGGLLKLGQYKALEQSDLWDIAERDKSSNVSNRFNSMLRSTADSVQAPEGRVGRSMWKVHGKLFILAGLIKLFHDIVMFLSPFILEVLLKHIDGGGARSMGVGLALALTATSVVETLTVNAYFHILFRICLHLKTGLVDMLYRKSLRLNAGKTSDLGVGAIVNLQSNDAAKLWKLPQYLYAIHSL